MAEITTAAAANYRVQLDLPPALYRRLADEAARRSATLDQIVRQVLEQYASEEMGESDIIQTWELCGALEVAEPDPEYIIGRDEQGNPVTNYAAHIDDVLYRGG